MKQRFGPYGTLSEANIDRFKASEANAVWFHGFKEELFERCTRVDAAACVEFRTFRAKFDDHPELVPTGVDGKPIRYGRLVQGVCLSQTDFIEEREAELTQGLRDFSPAGVWLDYLTYAGWFETPTPDLQESCFCPDCVAEFNEATGVDAGEPTVILERHADAWHNHKVDRIEAFGRRFAEIIRALAPGIPVGFYACPWYPEEHGGAIRTIFGQDIGRLSELFDVVTPLLYAQKCGKPASWSAEYASRAQAFIPASAEFVPILDALDYPECLTALADAGSNGPTASPVGGVQIFGGDSIFADDEQTRVFDKAVATLREAT